ncbi:hypothetical protein LPJ53_000486 [Coemansia erecta]|uniref:VASt domain-containing protein n=1 Tax=Coemansia erecta TaxID=147472 RepID=A0A9W7Y1X1_9FUNG|nr:hypothetical protein LPJ53_000486 [Coemansia erecta]
MSKEDKPRGLRARLRQRRARNSSEDEIKSRPTSLDLGRGSGPALTLGHSLTAVPTRASNYAAAAAAGIRRPNTFAGSDNEERHGGLALGEFSEDAGEEVVDGEEDAAAAAAGARPSGAILRSSRSQDFRQLYPYQQRATAGNSLSRRSSMASRRVSTHSVPGYTLRSDNDSAAHSGAYSFEQSLDEGDGNETNDIPEEDEEASDNQGSRNDGSDDDDTSDDADEDADHVDGDFDGDGELNAVYLKRNADFHMLFRNIPINELLIDDYGCALQRDILVQGRLYLTENFVCFYSNIFGWVTNLVIAFDEIMTIEKKMTALIIPNAIQVSTLHAKHFFGSFIYRDSAYNQLFDLWAKSRSEKHAGMPEIGRAEDGDGAGDVSKHREDVLNAYQSLSEDEEDEAEDLSGSAKGEGSDSGSASDTESEGSDVVERSLLSDASNSRNVSTPSALTAPIQNSLAATSVTNLIAGAKDAMAAAAAVSGSGSSQGQQPQAAAANGAGVSTGASPAAPQTGVDSIVGGDSPNDNMTRATSQVSTLTTKVQGTEANGTPISARSTASLANKGQVSPIDASTAAGTQAAGRLLSRLPKTPDATDGGSKASSIRGKQGASSRSGNADGAPLHRPTTCPCGSNGRTAHYSLEALDAVFPLSLPLLFRIVFSASVPADIESAYMPADKVSREELAKSCTKRVTECGNSDVKTEGWVPDPEDPGREMCIYTYEKPLGFSIGPKSTSVEDTFRIVHRDFDGAVVVEQVVRTPNVPSGTAFFVKIRHCLTWTSGPSNQPSGGWSHYKMTFEVEWTKTSWIKNAIEKGSNDSNKQAGEMLEKYIREWIAAHPSLEVKAPAHGIAPKSAGGSSSHKARRKGAQSAKKSRREDSPRGLRMEEVIGDSERARVSGKKGSKATAVAAETHAGGVPVSAGSERAAHAVSPASAAASGAAATSSQGRASGDAEAWRKRADATWAGWIGYHSVYPVVRGARLAGRATTGLLSNPVAGPLLVIVLMLLLLLSNTWRFASPQTTGPGTTRGASGPGVMTRLGSLFSISSNVRVDGMDELRGSVDALTEQMAVITKQLQQLIDQSLR